MKKRLSYLVLFVLSVVLWSCEKTTEGLTRITYYPTLEILGESTVILNVGETYTDEGCYAELQGEDVSSEVIATSNVDNSKPGVYSISYIIYNADGFSTTASRTVYVVDPDNIATLYLGESMAGTRHYYDALIYITDNGDGTYHLDDLMGGFQFNGLNPGFEPTYDFHAEVDFKINADNSISLTSEVGSWYFGDTGDVVLGLNSGSYDSATKTFTLDVDYGGTQMTVILRAITK
ncbi:DUF5011 domain-containing protein [Bacteroides caecigallinarum]|uniref:DUF5011 domain-containing protein n=1 Tax=Bacteroides caecigallinarum TaxID=1411144 RepID=UPI001F41883A|nr:DUF5011 domain-containing protein [Bacteroides caecigallinarum]MCF2737862.1 DUF5011 domain-containing protein [Bacteroides caecigallinarum]